MILTLAHHTFRECFRRPFPYVVAVVVAVVALASHLFQSFSFGAQELETANLAISAVFLAGLVHAAFQGTALVRVDLERGTLGLLLATPVGPAAYLLGRLLGLVAASVVVCAAVAGLVALLLTPFGLPRGLFGRELYAGWGRVLLPVIILDAAAIAASAAMPRVLGPLALLGVFIGGSLAGDSAIGILFPDFRLFGLEAGWSPSWWPMMLYTLVYGLIFSLLAYLALASRDPMRREG